MIQSVQSYILIHLQLTYAYSILTLIPQAEISFAEKETDPWTSPQMYLLKTACEDLFWLHIRKTPKIFLFICGF